MCTDWTWGMKTFIGTPLVLADNMTEDPESMVCKVALCNVDPKTHGCETVQDSNYVLDMLTYTSG